MVNDIEIKTFNLELWDSELGQYLTLKAIDKFQARNVKQMSALSKLLYMTLAKLILKGRCGAVGCTSDS